MPKAVNNQGGSTKSYSNRRRKPMKGKGLTPKQRSQVKSSISKVLTANVETKYHDTFRDIQENQSYNNASTSAIENFCVSAVPQGNNSIQRIGDDITPKYLLLRGTLFCGTASEDQLTQNRIVIFQHKPSNSGKTAAGITDDMFLNNSIGRHAYNPYVPDMMENYKILVDKRLDGVASGGNPDQSHYIEVKIPGKSLLPVKAESGTVIGYNAIYVTWFYDRPNDPTNTVWSEQPRLTYTCRLAYTDM